MTNKNEITQKEIDKLILEFIKKHSKEIKIDAEEFLDLLKHSLSLNTFEKKRVVDACSTLSQFQFDELKKVFVEERKKFKELASKHPEDIKKLLEKQQKEWKQLGDIYLSEQKKDKVEKENQDKIDDIKS